MNKFNHYTKNSNHPCRYCTTETGRCVGCQAYCPILLEHNKNKTPTKSEIFYNKIKDFEDSCGNFLGYTFLPDGRIKGKMVDFITVYYGADMPHVILCDNGIRQEFRLDKAMWRAYHCDYDIYNGADILHRNENEKDCRIKNLYIINM